MPDEKKDESLGFFEGIAQSFFTVGGIFDGPKDEVTENGDNTGVGKKSQGGTKGVKTKEGSNGTNISINLGDLLRGALGSGGSGDGNSGSGDSSDKKKGKTTGKQKQDDDEGGDS